MFYINNKEIKEKAIEAKNNLIIFDEINFIMRQIIQDAAEGGKSETIVDSETKMVYGHNLEITGTHMTNAMPNWGSITSNKSFKIGEMLPELPEADDTQIIDLPYADFDSNLTGWKLSSPAPIDENLNHIELWLDSIYFDSNGKLSLITKNDGGGEGGGKRLKSEFNYFGILTITIDRGEDRPPLSLSIPMQGMDDSFHHNRPYIFYPCNKDEVIAFYNYLKTHSSKKLSAKLKIEIDPRRIQIHRYGFGLGREKQSLSDIIMKINYRFNNEVINKDHRDYQRVVASIDDKNRVSIIYKSDYSSPDGGNRRDLQCHSLGFSGSCMTIEWERSEGRKYSKAYNNIVRGHHGRDENTEEDKTMVNNLNQVLLYFRNLGYDIEIFHGYTLTWVINY